MSQNRIYYIILKALLVVGLYLFKMTAFANSQSGMNLMPSDFGLSLKNSNSYYLNLDHFDFKVRFKQVLNNWLSQNPSIKKRFQELGRLKLKVNFKFNPMNFNSNKYNFITKTPDPSARSIKLNDGNNSISLLLHSGNRNSNNSYNNSSKEWRNQGDPEPIKNQSFSNLSPNKNGINQAFNPAPKIKNRAKGEACHNIYSQLKNIKNSVNISEKEQLIKDRCTKNRNDLSFDCIHWIAHQAVRAIKTEKTCADRISVNMMMCIINIESSMVNNVCSKDGDCGLTQITKEGARVFKNGINQFGLGPQFDLFQDLIGSPENKKNKCDLTNKSSLNRNNSIIMATVYMCTMVKENSNRNTPHLFCLYNAGQKNCAKKNYIKNSSYVSKANNCLNMGNNVLNNIKHQMYSNLTASCRKSINGCADQNKNAYHFAGLEGGNGFQAM